MPTELSVNVNSIAYLRNRRDVPWPDLLDLCRIALEAGAVGITVHPRPDQRHIRTQDVHDIAAMICADYPGKEFNIEGYPSEDFLRLVEQVKPDQATLVPDIPEQKTSDHGWQLLGNNDLLLSSVARLKDIGCRVSLFVDADEGLMEGAKSTGTDRVELYTGPYGSADDESAGALALAELAQAADAASSVGLGLNAGHDLTLTNLGTLLKRAPAIQEVSIGHGLTADALFMGYGEAVRRYVEICRRSHETHVIEAQQPI